MSLVKISAFQIDSISFVSTHTHTHTHTEEDSQRGDHAIYRKPNDETLFGIRPLKKLTKVTGLTKTRITEKWTVSALSIIIFSATLNGTKFIQITKIPS